MRFEVTVVVAALASQGRLTVYGGVRHLEVHRDPGGDGCQSVTNHAPGDRVAPLARPDARITVDNLLP